MDSVTKIHKQIKKNNSLVCVGLDPDISKIPLRFKKYKFPIFEFNKSIIDATNDHVAVYKPNIAFYEAEGIEGLKQLKMTITYLNKNYPQIPVVLDAKRADVPNTATYYAKAIFDYWNADATTLYPYLGIDSIIPYLEYKNRLVFLLLKTSNPDSSMFQDLKIAGKPFYLHIAKKLKNIKQAFGLFVGATYPKELEEVRSVYPAKLILSAGIGAQGGEIKKAVVSGVDNKHGGILFNSSRSIIYAQDPQKAAQNLKDEINRYR
ncbi:orotidine-5'-phosphate decarboxylase [Candidatus Curtissbacteria bacterium]|nr:orotidine-5'-phosphate decarboxylase [Candidatus Curtissbacteria bacterium]